MMFHAMNKLNTIPLALPKALHRAIKQGAKETSLPQAEVMRQSLRIGLPHFIKSFPKPFTKG